MMHDMTHDSRRQPIPTIGREEYEHRLTARMLEATHMSLWDMLRRSVDRYPSRPAVSMGVRTLTYQELFERSLDTASRLADLGVGATTRVAFFFHACPEWAVLHYALARLGAVAVPVSLAFEAAEIEHVLRSSEAELLITIDAFRQVDLGAKLQRVDPALVEGAVEIAAYPSLRRVVVLPLDADSQVDPTSGGALLLYGDLLSAPERVLEARGVARAGDPAYIVFTSGSTASPKPAVCSHGSFLGAATGFGEALAFDEHDRFLAMFPTFHVGGVACVLTMPHLYGACVDLLGGFAAELVLETIERVGSTVTIGFDAMFAKVTELPAFNARAVRTLRKAAVAATPTFIEKLLAVWPLDLVATSYGSTESGGLVAITPRWAEGVVSRTAANGTVLPGIELVVVDPDTNKRCDPGEAGEISFRGWCRVVEYLGMPKETVEAIDDEGFFHSGDYGWLDEDGFLHFGGRYKMMIKTGGENVAEREVEAFLERELTAVQFAQVVGVPDEVWGEIVVAFVQLNEVVDSEALRSLSAGRIAKYKIPRHFFALSPEEFPVLANGRPDKHALKQLAVEKLGSAVDLSVPPVGIGLRSAGTWDADADDRRRRAWEQLISDTETFGFELLRDLDGLPIERGAETSLCDGWSIRDIVLHLVVGDDLTERALRGENCFPSPTDDETFLRDLGRRNVEALGNVPFDESIRLFEETRERLLKTCGALEPSELGERVPWAAGTISRFAAVQARFMETWIHAWDVRQPAGLTQPLDDRAWWVVDLAVRTLPYALAKEGHADVPHRVRLNLDGPGGGEWDRVLARDGEGALEIAGHTWAWLLASSRRDNLPALPTGAISVLPSELEGPVLGAARAFA